MKDIGNSIVAVRGATTVVRDCKEEIKSKTKELIERLIAANNLDGQNKQCVSILISTTQDIHSYYPARVIRESRLLEAPLFSCAEPAIEGALPLCIRIMLTISGENFIAKHIYLHGAATLRPDLAEK